jgi:NADH:ubiquinone oxidoreductase subunit E
MKKVKVSICTGTACFVMGASEIMMLEDSLPEDLKKSVDIEIDGVSCLEKCSKAENGKAPFVLINGEVLSAATLSTVIEKIRQIAGE